MTTPTITAGHGRTPLIAALATCAALVLGGAIGVALEADGSTSAGTHSPASLHSYTRYFYWVAPAARDGITGPVSGSTGEAPTLDEFSGTTHPYPLPR